MTGSEQPHTLTRSAPENTKRIFKVRISFKLSTPIYSYLILIHSFNSFSLKTHYISSTVLGAGHTEVNEAAKDPCHHGANIPMGSWENNKQRNFKLCKKVRNAINKYKAG